MSYFGSGSVPKGSTTQQVEDAVMGIQCHGQDFKEAVGAQRTAKKAAIALITSGSVGSTSETGFNVSISGHANELYKAEPGVSGDVISVQITQSYA